MTLAPVNYASCSFRVHVTGMKQINYNSIRPVRWSILFSVCGLGCCIFAVHLSSVCSNHIMTSCSNLVATKRMIQTVNTPKRYDHRFGVLRLFQDALFVVYAFRRIFSYSAVAISNHTRVCRSCMVDLNHHMELSIPTRPLQSRCCLQLRPYSSP